MNKLFFMVVILFLSQSEFYIVQGTRSRTF